MSRFLSCGFLLACAFGAIAAAQAQQPVFRGTTEVVPVFVTVTDRDGRLVTNLKQEQFEIRDEGKAQPITLFDNRPRPIRLIVMLDVSGSMEGNLQLLRASAQQLFTRLLPGDRVRLGTFGEDIVISPAFTNDPNELRAALPTAIASNAPTPLWRAIDEAMTAFDNEGDRRVVLVLSDGQDSGPIGFRMRYVSQAEVIDRARNDAVMVYAIGMRSRSSRPIMPQPTPNGMMAAMTADWPDPGLAKVAEESGGGYVEVRYGEDLGAAFARVAEELHGQYLIGFAPTKRDGKKHDVEVRVTERGLKPRARKDYVAPK
jgi:Ca-activated chloride channel homolog